MSGENSDTGAKGDRLAKFMATSIASVLVAAVLGLSSVVWNLALSVSQLTERDVRTRSDLASVTERINGYPSAGDLGRCSGRLAELETYRATDEREVRELHGKVDVGSKKIDDFIILMDQRFDLAYRERRELESRLRAIENGRGRGG